MNMQNTLHRDQKQYQTQQARMLMGLRNQNLQQSTLASRDEMAQKELDMLNEVVQNTARPTMDASDTEITQYIMREMREVMDSLTMLLEVMVPASGGLRVILPFEIIPGLMRKLIDLDKFIAEVQARPKKIKNITLQTIMNGYRIAFVQMRRGIDAALAKAKADNPMIWSVNSLGTKFVPSAFDDIPDMIENIDKRTPIPTILSLLPIDMLATLSIDMMKITPPGELELQDMLKGVSSGNSLTRPVDPSQPVPHIYQPVHPSQPVHSSQPDARQSMQGQSVYPSMSADDTYTDTSKSIPTPAPTPGWFSSVINLGYGIANQVSGVLGNDESDDTRINPL